MSEQHTKGDAAPPKRNPARGTLFWWLYDNHDKVVVATRGRNAIWRTLLADVQRLGLLNSHGEPPKDRAALIQTFKRVSALKDAAAAERDYAPPVAGSRVKSTPAPSKAFALKPPALAPNRPPLKPNTRPWKCPDCAEMVQAGEGLIRRNRWCDTSTMGKWSFEHPECSRKKACAVDKSGLVYAFAEVGPNRRAIVKVGMTMREEWQQRINELEMTIDQEGKGKLQMWGVKVADRYQVEAQVHRVLAPYRVPGLYDVQREMYVAPIDAVLSAMNEAAGEQPGLFWEGERGHTD